MRLGAYPCYLKENTKVREIYNADTIHEDIVTDMNLILITYSSLNNME